MSLLPNDYKEPKKDKKYIKPNNLPEGTHKFRILSAPLFCWVYWTDTIDGKRKPVRVKEFREVPPEYRNPLDDKNKAYFEWNLLVWNYQDEVAQIMEIKQATIRARIQELDNDPDWGDARNYDIKITNTGKSKGDKYTVATGAGKTVFDTKDKDIPAVNLSALYTGGDPFDVEEITFDGDLGLQDLDS